MDMFQQKVPWALCQFNKQRFLNGLLHHGRFGGFCWGWFGARRKWRGRRIYATDLGRLLYRQKRTYWGGGNMSEVAEFCQIQGYTVTEFKSHVRPFSLETWSSQMLEAHWKDQQIIPNETRTYPRHKDNIWSSFLIFKGVLAYPNYTCNICQTYVDHISNICATLTKHISNSLPKICQTNANTFGFANVVDMFLMSKRFAFWERFFSQRRICSPHIKTLFSENKIHFSQ